MEISGEAVGAIMFIGVTIVLSLLVWFRYKARRDNQETLRIAIERGQELSPELFDQLSNPPVPVNRDFRRGVLSVGVAVGLVLFGFFFPEEDLFGIMSAIAMVPMLIGIAFLLLHRFGNRG